MFCQSYEAMLVFRPYIVFETYAFGLCVTKKTDEFSVTG